MTRRKTRIKRRTQWQLAGAGTYQLLTATAEELEPGLFRMAANQMGFFFVRSGTIGENLIRFPGTPIAEVVDEISKFWDEADQYARYGIPHRRGILLHGAPGSGKSCTLKLVAQDVIERGGVVFPFQGPDIFADGYRIFRTVQPETPVVVLMEDIESTIKSSDESKILQLLDGAEPMHKVVFLATTNYPENLQDRIKNRPSRFDRRFEVKHPNDAARRLYLESLMPEGEQLADINRYVFETRGMSLAHLKELFVSTVVMGNPFDTVIKELRAMNSESISSAAHNGGRTGKSGYA